MEISAFAQRLAANDQPARNRAIKKLKKYIAARCKKTGFSEEELLQLWKGLHYCFWMQDKPLLQEELSTRLCGLLTSFPDGQSALQFAGAFFQTQANEWGRLDQWRMDKFMMLIRDFLHATFEVLKKNRFDTSLVEAVATLIEGVMDARREAIPDGFRLHLAEIYLEELEKVAAAEITGDHITTLLEPFLHYIALSNRDLIADRVVKGVYGTILNTASTHSHSAAEDDEDTLQLNYDYRGIQQALFDAGRQKDVPSTNRRKLYKLVKRFSKVAGVTPGHTETDTSSVKQMSPGKRKSTDNSEEEPKKKKKKKSLQKPVKGPVTPSKNNTGEAADTDSTPGQPTPERNDVQTPKTPVDKKQKKQQKECPESTPKHVAFDLQRNSSRGLQEFVMSASTSSSPYHPSRSPKQGILKESPAATAPEKNAHAQINTPTGTKPSKGNKYSRQNLSSNAVKLGNIKARKNLTGKPTKGDKFAAKKKGRRLKKPKRH